jgi:pimeloyl-ACP methyl ester carboxylesterase
MQPFNLINAIVFSVSFSITIQSHSYGQTLFVTSPDSVRIAYEVHGKGSPTLVLVHGWSCDRSYWKGQIKPLSQEFKVVAIDLAGHGESGLGRKAWTIEAFGADVAAVVKKLNLSRVVLIGHSMGSNVIAEAARLLPGRIAGLVMVDQYSDLGPGLTEEMVQAFAKQIRTNFKDSVSAFVRSMFLPNSNKALVDQVAADMSSAPPAIALDALVYTLNYSRQMPRTIDELKLPVVALNAGNSQTDIASMKKHGVDVITMPGVGHFMMMENPEGFNLLLKSAINKFGK